MPGVTSTKNGYVYGWNHPNLTPTSIQISQLVEGIRHWKLVLSNPMSPMVRVHCLKHENSKRIPYFLSFTPPVCKTSIQISDDREFLF